MTPTERTVAEIISRHGRQLAADDISSETAMSQDAMIDGVGVDDFIFDLERVFGPVIRDIPWGRFSDQRASFRGCAVLLFPLWLVGRLVKWPAEGHWIPPPNGGEERLTVRHLAKVIDAGMWTEPGDSMP